MALTPHRSKPVSCGGFESVWRDEGIKKRQRYLAKVLLPSFVSSFVWVLQIVTISAGFHSQILCF
jgi:hypothetical protein